VFAQELTFSPNTRVGHGGVLYAPSKAIKYKIKHTVTSKGRRVYSAMSFCH